MRRSLIAVFAGLLGLTACGGDSGPGLDAYADSIAAAIQTDDDEDSLETTDDEARCIGDATATVIGLDALEEAGTPEEVTDLAQDDLSAFDLSDAKAIDVAQATFDCVDDILDQLVASLATGSEEADTCLTETLSESDLVPLLATSLQGEELTEEDATVLTDQITGCSPDDPSDDERGEYVSALTAFIVASSAELTEVEAGCIASDAIDIIGRERTVALGTPEEFVAATSDGLAALRLDDEEIVAIADTYFACAPATVDLVREGFVVGTELTGDAAACVSDAIDQTAAAKILAISLSGEERPALLEDLQSLVQTCA